MDGVKGFVPTRRFFTSRFCCSCGWLALCRSYELGGVFTRGCLRSDSDHTVFHRHCTRPKSANSIAREDERPTLLAQTSAILDLVARSVLLARNTLTLFVQPQSATPSPADSLGSCSRDSLREPAHGASLIPRANTARSPRFASAPSPARAIVADRNPPKPTRPGCYRTAVPASPSPDTDRTRRHRSSSRSSMSATMS